MKINHKNESKETQDRNQIIKKRKKLNQNLNLTCWFSYHSTTLAILSPEAKESILHARTSSTNDCIHPILRSSDWASTPKTDKKWNQSNSKFPLKAIFKPKSKSFCSSVGIIRIYDLSPSPSTYQESTHNWGKTIKSVEFQSWFS